MNIEQYWGNDFDMLMTCPPYADLEVYSDDERDISNKEYDEFIRIYRDIIKKSVGKLKDTAFAACVVGEVRDRNGKNRGFVKDTIQAFEDAGMHFYNELILVNCAGTLPLRAGKIFKTSRKVGKTHQNVLVFCKNPSVHQNVLIFTKHSTEDTKGVVETWKIDGELELDII